MIFNNLFDNIYVLNLKESTDRKIHIQNEFKRVGIDKYEFFEAVSYNSDEVKNLMKSNFVKKFPNCFRCNKKRCDCENNFLTCFQIGNWCSFINIFKDILNKDYEFVLLCEDDIVFSNQHERIINKLLSKESFNFYKIDMNKPLLIRMGTAYNPDNHNSKAPAIFLKNFSLCNPCFAINRKMALVYLHYLKIIDYHSDVYFHQKIPKNVPNVQYFTMYPYPVYELSFVPEKQKFESTIRPNNQLRRIEYKEFLFGSSNNLLTIFLQNCTNNSIYDIKIENIGYNGNINSYFLYDDFNKSKYYFECKIILIDDFYNDIKIIYKNIINGMKNIYDLSLKKINEKFNLDIIFENDYDNDKNNINFKKNIIKNCILYYQYYLKILDIENIIKLNINNEEEILNSILSKIVSKEILKKNIEKYNYYKNILLIDNDIQINNDFIDKYNFM
jgi:GR25 family glycosyltransferase involved in LPS biosynthesis